MNGTTGEEPAFGSATTPRYPEDGSGDSSSSEARSDAFGARSRFSRAEPEPQRSLRLVIQGSPSFPPDDLSMRIARRLGLDVWGDFLLGRRVAHEMGAAALVLLVVLTFELLAWSLLFNVLVQASQWAFTWRTPLACLLAAVFAGGVFLFERSFITADFSESSVRKALAYGLRLGIIFGSCVATAQPLELLVFGGAIETRLRDENALVQAARLVEELAEKADTKKRSVMALSNEMKGTAISQERELYRTSRDHLLGEAQRLRNESEAAARRVSVWDAEVKGRARRVNELAAQLSQESGLKRRALQSILVKARSSLAIGRGRLEDAQKESNSLERQLEQTQADLSVARDNFKLADTRLQGQWNRLTADDNHNVLVARAAAKELRDCVRDAQNVVPGKPLYRKGCVLYPKAADFTDRLRALGDIREGLPPAWPPLDRKVIALAVDRFGVESPDEPAGSELQKRRLNAARLFQWTYWIAFVVAAVIPLLTLAFKLMMSRELATYYSIRAQARAGNPAAILALHARGDSRD
jgi:hypothetical protein